MKIAYVYDAVYPWETGGVQKRVWEISRRLADAHDVHWYGLHYWDGPPTIEREGVTLHGIDAPTDLYVGDRRSITGALKFGARLTPLLLRERFDVIDCQAFPYFPVFASGANQLLHQSALIVTWHEVWDAYWYDYLGWLGVIGQTVERLTAKLPATPVAVSKRTGREVHSISGRTPRLVPNGISLAEITAAPTADRRVDVLFVGRLIPEKNPRLVVEAIAALRAGEPGIRCVIVGAGPEAATLERRVAAHDLESNVTLLPPRPNFEAVLALMKAADVFVLPSRREGFGMTVLEALACGTPVVTISHPQNAAQELVEDGITGVVCPPTVERLAHGIETARDLSGTACLETARDYEWSEIVTQLEIIYQTARRDGRQPRKRVRWRNAPFP